MCDSHDKLRCTYHDVLIICAGHRPLAVAAHFCEHLPNAPFNKSGHSQCSFINASRYSSPHKPVRISRRTHTALYRLLYGSLAPRQRLEIVALDANGGCCWMSAPNEKEEHLGITHSISLDFFYRHLGKRVWPSAFPDRDGREDKVIQLGSWFESQDPFLYHWETGGLRLDLAASNLEGAKLGAGFIAGKLTTNHCLE